MRSSIGTFMVFKNMVEQHRRWDMINPSYVKWFDSHSEHISW